MDSLWKNEGAKVRFHIPLILIGRAWLARGCSWANQFMKTVEVTKLTWSNVKNYQNWWQKNMDQQIKMKM